MKQNEATRRLAQEAREKIATIIQQEISDPRLRDVTVTGCEVAVDRSICRVYVAAAVDRYDDVLAGLESAKGRIRSLFGRSLTWRVTPELVFCIDRSTDEAMRITEALKNVPPTMSVPKDEFGYPLVEAEGDGEGTEGPAEDDGDGSPAGGAGEEGDEGVR